MQKKHPLLVWLRRRQMSCAEFSRVSGVDPTTLSLGLSGKRAFSLASAFRISEATDGSVPMKKLVTIKRRAA